MEILSQRNQALFETTKRLLCEIINEGLADATIEAPEPGGQRQLCLYNRNCSQSGDRVTVNLEPDTIIEMKEDRVISVVRPDSLKPSVLMIKGDTRNQELDPEILFRFMSPWFMGEASETVLEEMAQELRNSANNQEKWLEISAGQKLLTLHDSSIAWERALVYGHPSHPYHRLCYAQAPLHPVRPDDIPGMLTPTLAFISVPRGDLRLTGPFEQVLHPLLERLDIPKTSSDRVTVPCLAQQLPSILQRFPGAIVLKSITDCVDAQASMRTLTVRPEFGFGYNLKLSLACQITSALRTITPWTTTGGPVLTELLVRFLPADLWVFGEVASVTGSQKDFNEARHLSCILRASLESRADANDEIIIISAALGQHPQGLSLTYAEILFGLETTAQKQKWFRSYLTCLFALVLPPLINYGIGLEAHGQNLAVRICRQTGRIKGFAVRDFGGVRMHVPTLRTHGVNFDSLPPGGATLTDNLHNVWSKVHHSLLQNNVGLLLGALGLERCRGWAITRESLVSVLNPDSGGPGQSLFEFFCRDTMPFKCFLRMRMENKYRDYVEREVPNLLLMDSPRWESVLRAYQPSLHRT